MSPRPSPVNALRYQLLSLNDFVLGQFSEISDLEALTAASGDLEENLDTSSTPAFFNSASLRSVTLKRGIADEEAQAWFQEIGTDVLNKDTLTIAELSDDGTEVVMRATLHGAFPVKLSDLNYENSQGRVAIESIQLCYERVSWTETAKKDPAI